MNDTSNDIQHIEHAPLHVGIMGVGWPGERHAEGYQASGQARVVAVSDLEPQRRERFAALYRVERAYADYQELLADPDVQAVSVALPNFLHYPATMAALRAGKHVLCEKPPALSAAEAAEMEALAQQQGVVLAYALQRRFTPATEALLAQVRGGDLGDTYHARAVWTRAWGVPKGVGGWFTDPARSGGGALVDIGIHVLDLAWFLMGNPAPLTVSGQVYNKYPDLTQTDDSAFAFVRFAGGRTLHLEAAWALTQETDEMGVYLYGTAAGARVDDHSLLLYRVSEEALVRTDLSLRGGLAAFTAQATNFINAVRGLEALRTPAAHGTLLMQMLEAIYRSAREGQEVNLSA